MVEHHFFMHIDDILEILSAKSLELGGWENLKISVLNHNDDVIGEGIKTRGDYYTVLADVRRAYDFYIDDDKFIIVKEK